MSANPRTEVVVVNVNMPFWSMVRFMVKWAIAAIPALVILTVIGALLSALFTGAFTFSQNRKIVDASGGPSAAALCDFDRSGATGDDPQPAWRISAIA